MAWRYGSVVMVPCQRKTETQRKNCTWFKFYRITLLKQCLPLLTCVNSVIFLLKFHDKLTATGNWLVRLDAGFTSALTTREITCPRFREGEGGGDILTVLIRLGMMAPLRCALVPLQRFALMWLTSYTVHFPWCLQLAHWLNEKHISFPVLVVGQLKSDCNYQARQLWGLEMTDWTEGAVAVNESEEVWWKSPCAQLCLFNISDIQYEKVQIVRLSSGHVIHFNFTLFSYRWGRLGSEKLGNLTFVNGDHPSKTSALCGLGGGHCEHCKIDLS